MSDRKRYVIGDKEFFLKEDIKLRERIEVNSLVRKIPTLENRSADGLSYEETVRLLNLILEPANEEARMELVCEIDEPTQLMVFTDFFLRRMRLMLNGTESLRNTIAN